FDGDVVAGDEPPPRIVLGDRVDERRRLPVAEAVEEDGNIQQLASSSRDYGLGAAAGFASSFLITSGVRSRPGVAHAMPDSEALNTRCSPFSTASASTIGDSFLTNSFCTSCC